MYKIQWGIAEGLQRKACEHFFPAQNNARAVLNTGTDIRLLTHEVRC